MGIRGPTLCPPRPGHPEGLDRCDHLAVVSDGSPKWFAGGEGRTPTERSFLRHLRREASTWSHLGLAPQNTSAVSLGMDIPLFVHVDIPGLPLTWPTMRTLQVTLWDGQEWAAPAGGPVLQGSWTVDHRGWDHDGDDPENLTVIGVMAEQGQHAAWASAWLLRQLRRAVVHEEWTRGTQVVGERWRLADSGEVLHQRGGKVRRLDRRPPDRVTVIRDAG